MSPPPPEKGEKPVSGHAGSSDQDSRRGDESSRASDLDTADDRVGTDDAQTEEESPETTHAESTLPQSGTRSRLARFLISPFSSRQDENLNQMSTKNVPGPPVPSQDNSRHRAQLPSTDHLPGAPETPSSVQLPKNDRKMKRGVSKLQSSNDDRADAAATIAPGSVSIAEAGETYPRAEPPVLKDLDLGVFEPQFLSEMSEEPKADGMSKLLDTPQKPSPTPMKASRPATPESSGGRDFDGSSSGAEGEVFQEVEDPSRRVQKVMVDRVMSSFMNWLDLKLKVKNEDELPKPKQSSLGSTHWDSISRAGSESFSTLTSVPVTSPHSTEGGIQPIFDTTVPSRSNAAFRSVLPSPPPPPSLPAPGAPSGIPDRGKKVGVVPRLAMGQPRAPNVLMAAPLPPSSPARLANLQLRSTSLSPQVVTTAASGSVPKQHAARSYRKAQTGGLSARSSAKRSNKHDRQTDTNKEEEGENSDGEENRPPRAKLSKVHEDGRHGAKLACPFFKHYPRKYKNQRPCCGPGWDHVHRIKEHIYRKHSLPKFSCPRCSQPFETQADLQAHARSADACEVREPEFLDGFTQDQEKQLRSRKKTSAKELTEAEKWTQVYSILFPDVREREIPSPYYNTKDADTSLGGYEDYLRRELPPLVRRQLENEIERELSFVEEGMKQKVIEIARNLQLTLFKGYQQLENQENDVQDPPSVEASTSQTEGSTSSATDTSPSTMTTSGTTPDIPDPLELFSDHTFPDFDFTFLSEVPFPEEQQGLKEPSLGFGFIPSFEPQQPVTIQPGMELLNGQQLDLPYYGIEDYRDSQGHMRDAESFSYAP